MHAHATPAGRTDDRTVLALTGTLLALFALAGLATAFPGATVDAIGQAAYYLTDNTTLAGGAMAGTASVVGGGLAASSLSGLALAGAVAGGVVGVVAVGA